MVTRIDALPGAASAQFGDVFPMMRANVTYKLTAKQVLDLLIGGAPTTFDTLAELTTGKLSTTGGTLVPGSDLFIQNASSDTGIVGLKRIDGSVAAQLNVNEAAGELRLSVFDVDGITQRNQLVLSTSAAGQVKLNANQLVTTGHATGYLNALGAAPIYGCRAWVNFNGSGTVTARGSGNISSITDNGSGDYTANFATAMQDANYSAVFGWAANSTTSIVVVGEDFAFTRTASGIRINVRNHTTGTLIDWQFISVAIFR